VPSGARQSFTSTPLSIPGPILFVQKLPLKALEHGLGGPHQIQRIPFAQLLQVLFADHAPVHHPDPPLVAVLQPEFLDDFLHGRDIPPVAVEDLIGHRQSLGGHDQTDAQLHAVRTLIARMPALGLRVAGHLALEVGRGDVVEQEVERGPKPLPIALLKMGKQGLPVRPYLVQGSIEPVLVHLVVRDPQPVFQGGLAIPMLGDLQFRGWCAEPGQGQNAGHQLPRDLFASSPHLLLEELIQTQPAPQRQGQIHIAEVPQPFDANPSNVHRRPLRRGFILHEQIGRPQPPVQSRPDLLPAYPRLPVQPRQLAERSHRHLPGTPRGAHRLHQRPVLVDRSVFPRPVGPQIHAAPRSERHDHKDFNPMTRGWSALHRRSQSPHAESRENARADKPKITLHYAQLRNMG